MTRQLSIVDGWYVCEGSDGGFVVKDDHGVVEGPFRTKSEATAAALKLPRRTFSLWTAAATRRD